MPATGADLSAVCHESDTGIIPALSLSLLDEGVNEGLALEQNAKNANTVKRQGVNPTLLNTLVFGF